MATFVWTSVFLLLLLELALTMILVMPVPRKFRNALCRQVSKLHLKERLFMPFLFIGSALSFALMDCYSSLEFIFAVEKEAGRGHESSLDKQKEFKTERNMYLASFALTLLFVIGRLTDLMQEHVEMEDECEHARRGKPMVDSSVDDSGNVQIEMKTMEKKPGDKKIE
jgi:hypothetical protein